MLNREDIEDMTRRNDRLQNISSGKKAFDPERDLQAEQVKRNEDFRKKSEDKDPQEAEAIPKPQEPPSPFNADQLDAIHKLVNSLVEKRLEEFRVNDMLQNPEFIEEESECFDLEDMRPPIRESKNYWQATADASWNATYGKWYVVVQRVNQNGTLDTASEITAEAVGVYADGAPVVTGDRCIEVLTGDGRVVVVKSMSDVKLWVAQSDASWNSGNSTWEVEAGRLWQNGSSDFFFNLQTLPIITDLDIGETTSSSDIPPALAGDRLIKAYAQNTSNSSDFEVFQPIGAGGIRARGTESIFKAVVLRAYLNSNDTIVDAGTTYNPSTMYLYPTWDYIRTV